MLATTSRCFMRRATAAGAAGQASMATGLGSTAAAFGSAAPLAAFRFNSYKTQRVAKMDGPAPEVAGLRTPTRSSCAEDSGPVKAKPLSALQKRQLKMKDKKAFVLTPLALHRIKVLLAGHNAKVQDDNAKAVGIRVGVKRRGCSGYSYTINYALKQDPHVQPNDTHVEQAGIHVYVEHSALFFVIGTNMDFTTSNVEEKFTFKNPNEKAACGCGESFMPFDV